jgi:hypothetical protein
VLQTQVGPLTPAGIGAGTTVAVSEIRDDGEPVFGHEGSEMVLVAKVIR